MTIQLNSVSQTKLFSECERKWGFNYLTKLRTPPNAAAQLGIDIDDKQLQPYLREGKPFDLSTEVGLIAQAALPHLPKPMLPGLVVQQKFIMPSPTSELWAWNGYKDLVLPDSKDMPGCPGGMPLVSDFKSTKHWRYRKTKAGLSIDPQANLYAMDAMFQTGAKEVDLLWLYLRTTKPYIADPVYVRVTADHVAEQFEKLNTTGTAVFAVRQAFEALGQPDKGEEFTLRELPPNAKACDDYGGCPYRSKCNLSPTQIVQSLDASLKRHLSQEEPFMGNTVDLLASLKKRIEPVAVTTPMPVQLSGPVGGLTGYDLSPQQLDDQAAADAGVAKVSAGLLATPAWVYDATKDATRATPVPLGINSPESLIPPDPVAALPPAPPPVESKKRGRPAGAKNKDKDPLGADVAAHTANITAHTKVDAYEAAIAKVIDSEETRNAKIGALVVQLFALVVHS